MPTVQLVSSQAPNLLPMMGRSAGSHVSTLVDRLCLKLGHYQETVGPMNQARLELGNAFEHALIQRLELHDPTKYLRIGELEHDGMFGTPDLVDVVNEVDHEIKCTWMSSRHGPGSEKFWKYETQMRAYLHMLGWVRGRLHVCFVNGDYSWRSKRPGVTTDEGGPTYKVWDYTFTPHELAATWKMLKAEEAVMLKETN